MLKNTDVAGTGFDKRASIIRKYCKKNMDVYLQRDPENIHDENAIIVSLLVPRIGGLFGYKLRHIGYIKAPVAKWLAKQIDSGDQIHAHVESFWAPPDVRFPRVTILITDEY